MFAGRIENQTQKRGKDGKSPVNFLKKYSELIFLVNLGYKACQKRNNFCNAD